MILVGAIALVVSVGVQPGVIRILNQHSLWDMPNHRSSHVGLVPRGGGMAVIFAVAVSLSAATVIADATFSAQTAGLLILVYGFAALGFVDDLRGLGPVPRLCLQLVLASVVLWMLLAQWGNPKLNLLALLVLSIVWVVGYTNAFNFMDGINGISGFSAALAMAYFAWLGHTVEEREIAMIASTICGASLGFLPWNFPRARTFLGDVGSYFLGAAISSLALLLWLAGVALWLVLAPLVVYGADTAWTLLRRVTRGEDWKAAHRGHVYQRLADMWGHSRTSLFVTLLSGGLVLAAIVLGGDRGAIGWALISMAGAGFVLTPTLLRRPRRSEVNVRL